MYRVYKSIGAKKREPIPRFESAQLPDWLIEIHAREKMLAESRLKAARSISLNDGIKIIVESEFVADENEPSDESEPPDENKPPE